MQKICIIIPVFNEASRLDIKAYCDYIKLHPQQCLLFVNDGSTDNTSLVLEGLKNSNKSQIHVLNLEDNQGKAEAVRQGFLWLLKNLEIDIFGYLDADLAAPLSQVNLITKEFEDKNIQISFGSRINLQGSKIERSTIRHYAGRIFATFSSLLLNLKIYDTQCGAKFFKINDDVIAVFDKKFLTKWLFDIEIFLRFRNLIGEEEYSQKVKETPLQIWTEMGGSKLKLSDFFNTPFQIFKIWLLTDK